MSSKVDFVLMWVDGSDPKWLKEKNKYSEVKFDVDASAARYRDMGTLKYWFRAVEKYAPWVNNIYLITYGHLPKWLNTDNPKLKIINHKDYIPEKYLPTFSSHPIELNVHRIKDLSEKFVLFNDDMYILNPIKEQFFFKNGLPVDFWKENTFQTETSGDNFFDHIVLNDLFLVNKNFNKKQVVKGNHNKVYNLKYGVRNARYLMLNRRNYFCGFDITHTANAYLKSSFEEVWKKEPELLDRTSSHKFRSVLDVNQWAIHWYQMVKGNFSPTTHKNYGKYFNVSDNNDELIKYILDDKSTVACINDGNIPEKSFEKASLEIARAFERKLPDKSSFEK